MSASRKNLTWLFVSLFVAVLSLVGASRLLASTMASGNIPERMHFQGYLTDAGGNPLNGSHALTFRIYDTASGGTLFWQETHGAVPVSQGAFAVMLGSQGSPLTPGVFGGSDRYIELAIDNNPPLPRQQLAAVPYAMQAYAAQTALQATHALTATTAISASTATTATVAKMAETAGTAITATTATTATVALSVLDSGGGYARTVVVAESGGDYTSVAAALNSIVDASAATRYLVYVAAGVYTETNLVDVKPYIHLQGAGPNVTVVNSLRTGATPGSAAATAQLGSNGRISDLTLRNQGTGNYGIAVYSTEVAGRTAMLDNVVAEVNGNGGIGHYAAYLNDAELHIRNSTLRATGAAGFGTSVNAAIGLLNVTGGFPQPLIENSQLIGGGDNGITCADNTGTGFGIQMVNAAPEIRNSFICGGHRGIAALSNGQAQVHGSRLLVSSTAQAFLLETTNSAAVLIAGSGVFYTGNKHTGTGGLVCVHAYKSNFTAASNGTTAGTACN
jgi:hypothetical protein